MKYGMGRMNTTSLTSVLSADWEIPTDDQCSSSAGV